MPSIVHQLSRAIFTSACLGVFCSSAVAAGSASGGGGETPFGGSTPVPDNLLVPSEYATIQDAVDAASNGDVIVVASGFYSENVDINGKAVTIYGSGAVWIWPTIDAPVFTVEHTPDEQVVTLQGLTIRNPSDVDIGSPEMPGDDESESFTSATGLYATYASVYVTDCRFVGLKTQGNVSQSSHDNGGAISAYVSDIVLHRTMLQSCESTWGGAVWAHGGSFEAAQCVIRWNAAQRGGGLHLYNIDSTLVQCDLWFNEATVDGSQMGVCGGLLDMQRCRLTGDLAAGSAIRATQWYLGMFAMPPSITVADCRFVTGDSTEYTYVWYQDAGDAPSLASTTFCGLHRCAGVTESDTELALQESCTSCAGDVNHDGVTDMEDLMDMLLHWGDADPFTDLVYGDGSMALPIFDMSVGETDASDLAVVVMYFGRCE